MRYGTPLSPLGQVSDRDYADLADAGVVIIAAGVNEKTGGATDRKRRGSLYGLNENQKHDQQYRDAYATCMRSRGHTG